jgi:cell division protein FtsW
MTRLSRRDQSLIGQWWWTVDRPLLGAFLGLMASGIVLVAAASPPVASEIGLPASHFIVRHIIYCVPALIGMLVTSMLERRWLWRLASLAFAINLVLMMLIPFIGAEIKGAQRWLHIAGFSLQPSEFIKPAFVMLAAWLLYKQMESPDFPGVIIAAALYLVVITLLLLQPDLGMTFMVTLIFAGQIFLAGLRFRYLLVFAGLGLAAVMIVYTSFSHVQHRIDSFLDPAAGQSYQVEKAMKAFESGGLIGKGPGQGTVKMHLPDSHADFIFAVAGEEMGFIAVGLLILAFSFVVLRGLVLIGRGSDLFAMLGAGGLVVMLGLQAFIHMGSALHVLPTKGMTLPFISYGGSSLLAIAWSSGMILSLTRRPTRKSIARHGLIAKPQPETGVESYG